MPRVRTVVRSPVFERCYATLMGTVRGLDERLRGVEWAIATEGEYFTRVPGRDVRVIRTEPYEGPILRIYFRIDDADTCTLLWAEEVDWSEPDI